MLHWNKAFWRIMRTDGLSLGRNPCRHWSNHCRRWYLEDEAASSEPATINHQCPIAASPQLQGWSAAFFHETKTISKITNTTTTSANIPSCCLYNCNVPDKGQYWFAYVFTVFFYSYHLTHVSDFNTVSSVLQPSRLTVASSRNNWTIYSITMSTTCLAYNLAYSIHKMLKISFQFSFIYKAPNTFPTEHDSVA